MTNQQIIGEVEYFIVRNPYLNLPAEGRYPSDESLSLLGIKAEFLGTDFNYIYSEQMRKEITDNCLESCASMMQLDSYVAPLNSDWQVYLDRNITDAQFHNDIQEVI